MRQLHIALTLLATVPAVAAEPPVEPPAERERQFERNPALTAMPDNSWLELRPKGMA